MINSPINSITIDSLKSSFTFDGAFLVLPFADLISIFSYQNSFKTKFYTLLLVEAGSGSLSIDQEISELKKDRVFFVNYNQILRFSEVENFKGEAIVFTNSFYNLIYTGNRKIKNDTAFSDLPSSIDFSKNEFVNFKTIVAEVKREFSSPVILSKEIMCLLLKTLMLKYIRKTDDPKNIDFRTDRRSSYIEDFRKLVEIHFKELKRTSDYAKKLTITANYLNALVKEKLDISAENFIQNRVILEAERLLLNTDLSVTEISFELGFSDKSHFGKYFKKLKQESPNQFRKKMQANTITFKTNKKLL